MPCWCYGADETSPTGNAFRCGNRRTKLRRKRLVLELEHLGQAGLTPADVEDPVDPVEPDDPDVPDVPDELDDPDEDEDPEELELPDPLSDEPLELPCGLLFVEA